ncbi:MAG: peptidase associated/transthyretin-like domain-containing protein [Gemmataceae bacterium]
MPWCRVAALGFALLAALATPACGPATGKLYGVATYAGKPVAGGVVLIVGDDKDHPVRAPLDSEGKYTASGIPVGPVKIAVLPPPRMQTPPLSKLHFPGKSYR